MTTADRIFIYLRKFNIGNKLLTCKVVAGARLENLVCKEYQKHASGFGYLFALATGMGGG